MKKSWWPLMLGLSLLGGCAHPYVLKMSNGNKILTASAPKLEKGFYVYKDARGDKHAISQGRVVEIYPASMAPDESSQFKGKKSK